MKRNISILFAVVCFTLSCSKDEQDINHMPIADYKYTDQIDKFVLTSTSDDPDNDILTYQWMSNSSAINIVNSNQKSAYFDIPQLSDSIEISLVHIVCDEYLYDTISKNIQIPILTRTRKWGLGRNLKMEVSNNVDYEWYIDQMNTGIYSYLNCGPTVVTMAIKWTNKDFDKTPEDARNTYNNPIGVWYTKDIINYLHKYAVNNIIIDIPNSDSLVNEIDNGNIIILCLDMFYISKAYKEEWRINKFYLADVEGSGHFIVIKGYKVVDEQILYEVYDPNSFGTRYNDNTLKGKDRYYKSKEIDDATNNWWDYAIIVSRYHLKSTRGLKINDIQHCYGY